MRATCYLWGADQIYKRLFAGDCSKNLRYHLTFSPKSICLRHQRKLRGMQLKVLSKLSQHVMVQAEMRSTGSTPSVQRGSPEILLPSVCCLVYCNATQHIITIYCNLDLTLPMPLNNEKKKKKKRKLFRVRLAIISRTDKIHSKIYYFHSVGIRIAATPHI